MFGKPRATEKPLRQLIGEIAALWTGRVADAARRPQSHDYAGDINAAPQIAAGLLNTLAMSTVALVATVLWTILEFADSGLRIPQFAPL
jgi:hypothetical protein